jgi:2-oxoglutarate ferredoxin oxidoreductase subunit delta
MSDGPDIAVGLGTWYGNRMENPETGKTMSKAKCKVVVNSEGCKGCNLCITFCKRGVLKSSEDLNRQGYHYAMPGEENECNGCMICTLVCPEVVIEVYGE